jgi:RNA polymerase sigma-70 factor (ECF subfamily)
MNGSDIKEGTVLATANHLKPVPNPPEELASLFQEHYQQIFRTAYRVTGSAVDAEDVLQTIFLRLARRKEFDLSPSPGSYFHRAAINAALDLVRSRSRSGAVPLEEMGQELTESPSLSPEARQRDRELRRIIHQAIARLGQRAAEAFVLRYLEGYDNREIAALLGTSQMVIAVTLHRARTRLRKEISSYLEESHVAN